MFNDTGFAYFTGGINDASNSTFGGENFPLPRPGVNAFDMLFFDVTVESMKIPPWDSVYG